jgi:hypothetical protein
VGVTSAVQEEKVRRVHRRSAPVSK